MPLALGAQSAGTTVTYPRGIHHPQAAIGFSALFRGRERLPSRTAQRPIGLEGKVATREAALLPGQRCSLLGIPLPGGSSGLCGRWGQGWRKLGGARWFRFEVVAQFKTQVPHPLADDLPALLAPGGMRTPTIRILFLVFIGQCILKRAAMQVQRHHIGSRERVLGSAVKNSS